MTAGRIVRRRQHLRYGKRAGRSPAFSYTRHPAHERAYREGLLTLAFLSGALVALVVAAVL